MIRDIFLRSSPGLALLFLLFFAECSGRDRKFQQIQDLIQAGNRQEAEDMIKAELLEENRKLAKEFDDGSLEAPLASPGARTAVWVKGESKLVILRNGKRNEVSLGRRIKNIQLAPGGKFALILVIEGQGCKLAAVDLLEREVIHEISSCDPGAAITGDGQEILYSAQGGVGRIHLKNREKTVEDVLLEKSSFAAHYPKLTNRYYVVPDAQNHLYVFFGSAGMYKMYLFVSGQNISMLKDGAARPQVYFADPEPELIKSEAKLPEREALGVIFTGSAGKYRLASVFADRVSDETLPAPTIDPIQMLASGRIFYLNGETPALYHPVTGRKNLPMRARDAVILYGEDPEDQGILYQDLDGSIRFRREAFTEWEKKIQGLADRLTR
ncbi:MAG TPA: hypothetical protein PLW55_09115 [Leptospiraceae bacterium]|nr:hypothetical protein [Leptospiraceae bacterium]